MAARRINDAQRNREASMQKCWHFSGTIGEGNMACTTLPVLYFGASLFEIEATWRLVINLIEALSAANYILDGTRQA